MTTVTSSTSEKAQGIFSKITFLKSTKKMRYVTAFSSKFSLNLSTEEVSWASLASLGGHGCFPADSWTKVCLCEGYKFSSKLNAAITLQDLIVITFSRIILLNKKSSQVSFQMIWSDMAEQLYFDITP